MCESLECTESHCAPSSAALTLATVVHTYDPSIQRVKVGRIRSSRLASDTQLPGQPGLNEISLSLSLFKWFPPPCMLLSSYFRLYLKLHMQTIYVNGGETSMWEPNSRVIQWGALPLGLPLLLGVLFHLSLINLHLFCAPHPVF